MSNLFQHLTPGFEQVVMILELVLIYVQPISAFYLWLSASVQTISWFYHWFLSNSNLCQYSATVFQATAQPISAFPLVCNHCSAYFSTLPWVFIYFFHSQDWFSSVFFFRSLSHQLSSLCHCFSLFMFIHFHVVVTCYPLGIVFTWPLFWYMLSSMLVICNCFIFRFHHISYIYIVAPSQVFCFKEIRKLPQEDHQTCDAKSLYQFWHCKCHSAFNKYLNY